MANNTNRTIIVIARKLAAAMAAITITALNAVPVHALSFSLGYLDNGDGTLYDEEKGIYVDMDTYHAAYGYEYNKDSDAYGYWSDDYFYTCNCSACNYWKEGHKIVIPGQDSGNADGSSAQDEAAVKISVLGKEVGEGNLSGESWSCDQSTGTLMLDSFNYEGTGLFGASDNTANNEDEASESDEAESDDEEWDDSDEESWVDEDAGEEDSSDSESSDAETSEAVKGVLYSGGDLTLNLKGVSRITVTDEGSDASYAVNAAGEIKVEGDGVLYVKSATEEKVYGTEPTDQNAAGNYENININTNDIDNTQTVNEAPVTQNVDDGDVTVSNSNNVDMPDFANNISLPGASNTITFNPTVEVRLPETTVERTIINGMQQRYPELAGTSSPAPAQLGRCADTSPASADVKLSAVDTDTAEATDSGNGTVAGSPETGDSLDLGVIMALIATIAIGGGTGGYLLWKRVRGY